MSFVPVQISRAEAAELYRVEASRGRLRSSSPESFSELGTSRPLGYESNFGAAQGGSGRPVIRFPSLYADPPFHGLAESHGIGHTIGHTDDFSGSGTDGNPNFSPPSIASSLRVTRFARPDGIDCLDLTTAKSTGVPFCPTRYTRHTWPKSLSRI